MPIYNSSVLLSQTIILEGCSLRLTQYNLIISALFIPVPKLNLVTDCQLCINERQNTHLNISNILVTSDLKAHLEHTSNTHSSASFAALLNFYLVMLRILVEILKLQDQLQHHQHVDLQVILKKCLLTSRCTLSSCIRDFRQNKNLHSMNTIWHIS